jgi:xanthine/uracil permease
MRFVITLLCVTTVVFVPLALVVIEAIIKLLPVLIAVMLIVLVARRLGRRHGTDRGQAHVVNVPGESAFLAPPSIDRALIRRPNPPYPHMIIDGQLGSEGPPRD